MTRPVLSVLLPLGEVSETTWTRISYRWLRLPLPLGRAIVRAARHGAPEPVLESRDMVALGQ